LTKLKEIQSGKISIILESGLNSGLKGEKNGKTPYNLLFESMRCPFTKIFWQSVSVLIEWMKFRTPLAGNPIETTGSVQ